MIRLVSTTGKIQVSLGGAVTTSQLQCFASWIDFTANTAVEGHAAVLTNNSTDVDLISAPSVDTSRCVDYISIYNNDTVNATVTVKLDISGTDYILTKVTLATGERLEYCGKDGFVVKDVLGCIKTATYNNSGIPVVNNINVVVLSGDVVNNNATANTMQDVTGLQFPVVANKTYWFEFVIPYTSAATTTGSRWGINGPAIGMLNGTSEYTLTATTKTLNNFSGYDTPAACNATSLVNGNLATIWGIIQCLADGNITARFASEVASSAITAKAGATVRYMRVI